MKARKLMPDNWPKGAFWRALWKFGSLTCHQLPERSFFIRGKQMPVCARCFGIYVGFVVGGVTALVFNWGYIQVGFVTMAIANMISIIPMGVDGLTQYPGYRESNNYIRFGSGFLAGVVLMYTWASSILCVWGC